MNNNKNDKNIAEQMKRLIELINFHDELYYIKNYQEISDYEYDNLRKELMDLENNARKNRIGLWNMENPIAPWNWRKEHKFMGVLMRIVHFIDRVIVKQKK